MSFRISELWTDTVEDFNDISAIWEVCDVRFNSETCELWLNRRPSRRHYMFSSNVPAKAGLHMYTYNFIQVLN